jgi:hypothetical protein
MENIDLLSYAIGTGRNKMVFENKYLPEEEIIQHA